MTIVYTNHVDDATITASSSASGFGTANLQDLRASRVWRSDGSTSITIVFDFGSAVSFAGVGIAGHNFTSGATVTLEWNSADSWGSPAGSQSVTVDDTCVAAFTSVSYRYARLSVTDASNTDGYIEIGRVSVGAAITGPGISDNISIPRRSTTNRQLSRGRQPYIDPGVKYRSATITWPYITEAQRDDMVAVFDAADVKPVFLDFGVSSEPPMYATIDGSADLQYRGDVPMYTLSLTFEEVL
jgi:hypothetical protein